MNYSSYRKKCGLVLSVGALLLLTACAATQTSSLSVTPQVSSVVTAPTVADTHVSSDQQALIARLDQLQTNLLLLEARVMDQQKLIEQLRKARPTASPVASQEVVPVSATTLTPAELYRKAFTAYAAGRYDEGLAEFKRFVTLFPTSEYAANANYWLAECHLAQKEYPQAASIYREVAREYARSSIAPKALWKEALALTRAGSGEDATKVLRTLHERYPNSKAANRPLPKN